MTMMIPKEKDDGYIYAIGAANASIVKIGSTQAGVSKRLRQLQTGHPDPLVIVAQVYVSEKPHHIEKQIHRFLESERRNGEWFEIAIDHKGLEELVTRAIDVIHAEKKKKPILNDLSNNATRKPTLGQVLRQRRLSLGIQKQALANQAGITEAALRGIEHGIIASPRVFVVFHLADALGLCIDDVVAMVERPPQRQRPYVRQESLDGGSLTHDPATPYQRQPRRRGRA